MSSELASIELSNKVISSLMESKKVSPLVHLELSNFKTLPCQI